MIKGNVLIAFLLIASIAAAGCTSIQQTGDKTQPDGTLIKPDGTMIKPDGTMVKPDGTMILPNETIAEPEDAMMKNDSTDEPAGTYSGAVLAGSSAVLLDFNKADYNAALETDKVIVLYFYANWCPVCRAEFPAAQAAFNELKTDKVIGFRVNFNDDQTDNDEKEIARQFGVPYQHTKVFIKNKVQILKSPETWDKARYISEINKALG